VNPAPARAPQRVFITGALGFIGRALMQRYRTLGVEVYGMDRAADDELSVVAGDVAEPGAWQLHAAGCDVFIHTAAIVSNAAELARSWHVNVLGTRRALDAAARGGARRFVHLSSVRAFSDLQFPDGVDERHPVRTDGNPYVDTKVAAEHVVLQAHAEGELQCTVIRPGDVYGPGSRPWTLLPLELIKARRFVLPAMGRGIFSPVYIDDLVDGVLLAVSNPGAAGSVITIADEVGVTCKEFFGHYYRMLGERGPVVLPTPVAVALAHANAAAARLTGRETEANPTSVRYLARTGTYSIARARKLLGYEPAVDLAEGMRRTEAWLRDQSLI
jgi:nucleoside-diphosphate-sugar epimerase